MVLSTVGLGGGKERLERLLTAAQDKHEPMEVPAVDGLKVPCKAKCANERREQVL